VLGFIKAFNLLPVDQLSTDITQINGVIWLIAAVLFLASAPFIHHKRAIGWIALLLATILSQYLIATSWHDSKFGTIANIVIGIVAVVGLGTWGFRRTYRHEITEAQKNNPNNTVDALTESEIQHLPEPVKKYLRYTGAIGKPKVQNFKVKFTGEFRQSEEAGWMPFHSEQTNFVEHPTRLFFMTAMMKHLPVVGFHYYKKAKAAMDIRLLSLFRVQHQSGPVMDTAETVTFFNDMCVMAPSTLIDPRIKWLRTEGNIVQATFTNDKITISAELCFNDKGELINFTSDDRPALQKNSMIKARWSTPLSCYATFNGFRLASYAETIYSFPEGDFCYGKFRLNGIAYN